MTNGRMVPLAEVVEIAKLTVKPENIDPGKKYVLLEHIVPATGQVTPGLAGESDIRSAKTEFKSGDVLYGKLRPKLRKVCAAVWEGYCSTDILPLRPVYPHSTHYLASVLRSERFYFQVERIVSGANLPRVNPGELLQLEVPWPDESDLHKAEEMCMIVSEMRNEMNYLARHLDIFEKTIWRS